MTMTSESQPEAHPLAAHIDDGAAKLEPVAAVLPDPIPEPARRQKYAVLPIVLLAVAILITISWNALLLWQFLKGVMFVFSYAFS